MQDDQDAMGENSASITMWDVQDEMGTTQHHKTNAKKRTGPAVTSEFPATHKAEAGGSLEPRSLRIAMAT